MRSNHMEAEKKQETIINDLKGVKTNLKIPKDNCSHAEYLSSNFFQEQSMPINERVRTRTKKKNKTNFFMQTLAPP